MPRPARFLVTAGNTREPIDHVRVWTNIFSGSTGLAIAHALLPHGDVTLLTGNPDHAAQLAAANSPIRVRTFTSHADLRALLAEEMTAPTTYDAVYMTAAVADYTPDGAYAITARTPNPDGTETWTVRNVQSPKIPSSHPQIAIAGKRTEKLVDLFRTQWHFAGLLVKFKLQVGIDAATLIDIAEESRAHSAADFIVANTLDMVAGPNPGAWLLGPNLRQFIPRPQLAPEMARLAAEFLRAR